MKRKVSCAGNKKGQDFITGSVYSCFVKWTIDYCAFISRTLQYAEKKVRTLRWSNSFITRGISDTKLKNMHIHKGDSILSTCFSFVFSVHVSNLWDFVCLFTWSDVRTEVQQHIHTHTHRRNHTYMIVSQLLFVVLSLADNRVCVNDILQRARSNLPVMAAAKMNTRHQRHIQRRIGNSHPIRWFCSLFSHSLCRSSPLSVSLKA